MKFLPGLIFIGVIVIGVVLLLRRLWMQSAVQQRWEDFTQPVVATNEADQDDRWWLSRWLFLAGYRRPGADVIFIAVTLTLLLLGMLVAAGIQWSGIQRLMEVSIVQVPGGVGETFLPVVWVAPWMLLIILTATPWLVVRAVRRKRVELVEQDLPMALELLSTLSQAGLGFDAALSRILKTRLAGRPLAEELDLQMGLPRILTFRQPPLRTYVPESGSDIVAIRYIDPEAPHRVAIEPLSAGTTMLTMWFRDDTSPDGEEPVSWIVTVTDADAGGPALKSRNRTYQVQLEALEREVNYAFPNSNVKLSWVGSQVLVRGKAKDVEEATQITRIVSSSIPGSRTSQEEEFIENFGRSQFRAQSGSDGSAINNVINMPGDPDYLSVDSDLIREAGSLAGALRGDTRTGVNQGRINNRIINLLEIAGVHQVMLKVTVAEVNRSASRTVGADLQIGSVGDAARFFTTLGTPANGGSLVLDQGDFDLVIAALKRLNLAKSLAEPTLTTLNGQPAIFNVGGSFPVPIVTGQTATGLQGVDFQNFGVQLQFVPVVTDGDRIRLTLQASVSTRDETAGAQVGNTNIPGLNSRNFSNTVELREGQTLAVAGLIQSNLGGSSARVPFLGDVPVVGRLFSNDGTSYDEQELVVLVTPYLVAPVDAEECPPPLPGSDYYEPDDIEFFIRGSLAGHIAEDYRSPVRTDLHKMKAFRRCEQKLIIGQPGHSNGLLCPPANIPNNMTRLQPEFSPLPEPFDVEAHTITPELPVLKEGTHE